MIRHILKIIWNERKANGWIIVEFIVVFCVLWFCCDYMSFIVKSNHEPLGFDIDHTYEIRMSKKTGMEPKEEEAIDHYSLVQTFIRRVKQYPGVESVSFSNSAAPYLRSSSSGTMVSLPDSIHVQTRIRYVSSEFFDVFKIKLEQGRIFNWEDNAESKNVIVSGNRNGHFEYTAENNKNVEVSGKGKGSSERTEAGDKKQELELSKIRALYNDHMKEEYPIVGIVNPTKEDPYAPYLGGVYYPLGRDRTSLNSQIVVRITPHADKDFPERFTREMRQQLNLDPYFLASVVSLQSLKKDVLAYSGITGNLNSIYAITTFLVINIFLGIIGTFWYRVQARRNEIGTRISMGATRKDVQRMLFGETLLLLFIASFVAVNICLNIAQTDFLEAIGLPKANREQIGMGIEQDVINYFVTYFFLAIISLLAVWYPTRQASRVAPAEALREE
ncbi:FtsX-like permease family protein [Parabacteroides sp. PF5-6]|uniref:ABC transporter permease n=1 Tax=Parabacteroides sp. PF5-6 TaxID=1742403 RepID=UPI002404EB7A|nr:FtsX-like permease family protein [Parabacteroides sp. PF5-6]MDF9831444.1 putative ABC transport system permease protein [Parabacteroides sp. PF5-6]